MPIKYRPLKLLSHIVLAFTAMICLAGTAAVALSWQTVAAAENARQEAISVEEEYLRSLNASAWHLQYWKAYTPTLPELLFANTFVDQRTVDEGVQIEADENKLRLLLAITGVFLIGSLGFIIASSAWLWRACRNLQAAGVAPDNSPARTVISFVTPVLNLALSFETVRELYNRSRGAEADRAHAPNEEVNAWFISYVVGTVILSFVATKYIIDALTNLVFLTPWWMELLMVSFAIALLLLSGWLFANLTRKISAAQAMLCYGNSNDSRDTEAANRPRVSLLINSD